MKEILNKIGIENPETLKKYYEYFSIKSYNKDENIMQPGDTTTYMYYVVSGLVRIFHVKDNGEERTLYLKFENSVFGNHHTTIEGTVTKYFFQCMEDTVVLRFEYSDFLKISKENHDICYMGLAWSSNILVEYKKDKEDHIIHSTLDRYNNLVARFPTILQRVPYKHIASLIGVTPVTLSRILKDSYEKK